MTIDHYIIFHAEKDVFKSCDAALEEAAKRDGCDAGFIICLCLKLHDGIDMRNEPATFDCGHYTFPVESEPVAIYAAPATSAESVSTEFPGKIKEWNIQHMSNAYKDAPFITKLRKTFSPEQICDILTALER